MSGKSMTPPGITDEQWVRHEAKQQAVREASSEVLPGPLNDVIGVARHDVGGLRVRPLVHYDYVILKRINSPLYLRAIEASKGDATAGTECSDEDGYEMVFLFTRPVLEAKAALERGRDFFRDAAIEKIGCVLTGPQVVKLVGLCVEEFIRSASTSIEYQNSQENDGSFFFKATGQ